jgi:hypothetical protein
MLPVAFTEDQLNTLVSAVTSRVLATPLAQQPHLSGPELMQLHHHPQVNQLVLFQLFTEWQGYMQRVRHPHFDFDHPAVVTILEELRVQLSHHIRLPQQELRPMLTKAVYNNIRLLLTPWDSLARFFFADKDLLRTEDFYQYAGFFTDFDFVVQSLEAAYRQKGTQEVSKAAFLEHLQKTARAYTDQTGVSLEDYRSERFETLTGQSLESWQQATPPPPRQGINTLPGATPPPMAERPVATMAPTVPPTIAPTVAPLPEAPTTAAPARLADKFQPAKANPTTPTVPKTPAAIPLATGGVLTLESIPLHKQFQYIQKVFGGDAQRMKDTLAALNQLESPDAMADYLRTRIFNMPDNTHDAKINQEFLEFAQQRFKA